MTVRLESTITIGATTLAALVESTVSGTAHRHGIMIAGSKRPVAFLFRDATSQSAQALDGTPLSPAEVEALCPGAWQMFMQADE